MILQAIRDQFQMLPQMIAAVGYSPAASPAQVAHWAEHQIKAAPDVVLADFRACYPSPFTLPPFHPS